MKSESYFHNIRHIFFKYQYFNSGQKLEKWPIYDSCTVCLKDKIKSIWNSVTNYIVSMVWWKISKFKFIFGKNHMCQNYLLHHFSILSPLHSSYIMYCSYWGEKQIPEIWNSGCCWSSMKLGFIQIKQILYLNTTLILGSVSTLTNCKVV